MRVVLTILAMLLLAVCIASGQNYFWGNGNKYYFIKSSKWATIQVAPQDRNNVQSKLESSGLTMRRTIRSERGIYWIESPPSMSIDMALNVVRNSIQTIRTFPSFISVYANNDTTKYILFDEFIVKFHDNITKSTIDSLNSALGVETIRVNQWGEYLLRIGETSTYSTLDLANLYYEQGFTVWSQPNFLADIYLNSINDPLFSHQWHLYNTGQTGGPAGVDINAVPAWNITTGDSNIVVAVIDDGVEMHEDFHQGQLVQGFTAATGGDGSPAPESFHGQCVAGIIAANHNSIGIRGVTANARIMSVRIFTFEQENEPPVSDNSLAAAIDTAWQRGAQVLNNSWQWGYDWIDPVAAAIQRALTYGRDGKGCFVVFSSGNDYSQVLPFPNRVPGVLAVGALSYQNLRPNYSNYGERLDAAAPSAPEEGPVAAWIFTMDRMGNPGLNTGNYTDDFGGTSASAPQVSGIGALLLSVNPNLSNDNIRTIIQQSADKVGGYDYNWNSSKPGHSKELGYGRVNAYKALTTAMIPILSSPVTCANVSNPPTLTWNPLFDVSSYRVQIATNSDFSNLVRDTAGITTTSDTVNGLANTANYYWRVSAFTVNGTTYWSNTRNFHTLPPPASQLTGTTVRREYLGEMLSSPLLSWTVSSWCNVTYGLYKYICSSRHGCPDTIGTCIYSGLETSYIDSTWIVGPDSTYTVHYYVKATGAGAYSISNKVSYNMYNDFQKEGFVENKSNPSLPKETGVQGNSPNPFNPQTIIYYSLKEPLAVKLVVYDLLGKQVQVLVDEWKNAGYHSVEFNATNLPSGIYFYRLQAGIFVDVKKMVIAK